MPLRGAIVNFQPCYQTVFRLKSPRHKEFYYRLETTNY